jgi:hypothetical protein
MCASTHRRDPTLAKYESPYRHPHAGTRLPQVESCSVWWGPFGAPRLAILMTTLQSTLTRRQQYGLAEYHSVVPRIELLGGDHLDSVPQEFNPAS